MPDDEELRRAHAELEETRDRYLELFDLGPVASLLLDATGRIANVNRAGAALLGVDAEGLKGRPFAAFVAVQDLSAWRAHVHRVGEAEAPQTFELRLTPEGRMPFEAQVTAVRASAGGARRGIRCAVVDVTDRRRADEERRRRIEELAGLNRRLEETQSQLVQVEKLAAIGQLAAGVAHEINNPLTYVVSNLFLIEGYLDALLDPRRHPGEGSAGPGTAGRSPRGVDALRREFLQSLAEAKEGAERVARVVRDLVAYARPDGGGLQTVEVHALVEAALRELEGGRGRVAREYGPGPIRLRCRPSQVVRVLHSVLVNAAQATGPSGTITIRTGLEGGDAWIEIEDTGVGIAPKDLSRVFEPYFTTRQVGAGTGMGLAIAHAIVRGYGGRFEVRSVLGVGSAFRIVLPAAASEGEGGGDARPSGERGR